MLIICFLQGMRIGFASPAEISKNGEIMKISKNAKILRLKKSHIKNGIKVSGSLHLREVPLRKFKSDVLNEVKYGRTAVIVTEQGKQYGVFTPLPLEVN